MSSNVKHCLGHFRPPGINGEERRKKLDPIYLTTGDFAEAVDERLDPRTFLLLGNLTPGCSRALASDVNYICARRHMSLRHGQRVIDIQGTVSGKRVIRDVYDSHDQGT